MQAPSSVDAQNPAFERGVNPPTDNVKARCTASPRRAALGVTCPTFRCGAVPESAHREIALNRNALRKALL